MEILEKFKKMKMDVINYPDEETKKKVYYDKNMLPPRERIGKLLDENSFLEFDALATHQSKDFGMEKKTIPADGVITGVGTINNRKVAVYAQDFAALGGTYGEMHGKKICALMDLAAKVGMPVIGICHSGGLRLHETLGPMKMFGELFKRNSIYSGRIPQISLIFGVVAGGQAYSPGLTDFVLMTKESAIYIAGPAFVKAQTGIEISDEELGGAKMHATVSGVVDIIDDTEENILQQTRKLMNFLPPNCEEEPPVVECTDKIDRCDDKLNNIAPIQSFKPFDMKKIIYSVVDNNDFLEIKADFAKNMIVGFARLGGYSVGIVANQPNFMGGVIDIKGAEKAARFVRFCDAFNIPIITFQDSPAYLIGKQMEQEGMICKGAKLLYAYSEATVPKITIIVRKAYAGAYIAMGSQYTGADLVYAWPGAEISSVAPKTAASILFRKELKEMKNEKEIEKLFQYYYDKYVNATKAASLRHINDIIEPKETRPILIKSLKFLQGKKVARLYKKHGNIPL